MYQTSLRLFPLTHAYDERSTDAGNRRNQGKGRWTVRDHCTELDEDRLAMVTVCRHLRPFLKKEGQIYALAFYPSFGTEPGFYSIS